MQNSKPFIPAGGPVLVTGGSGFIGKRLVARLTELGAAVLSPRSSDLDLRDSTAVQVFFNKNKPKTVFHLASTTLGRKDAEQFLSVFDINTRGSVNVLSASIENDVSRLILTGTGDELGTLLPGPGIDTPIGSGPRSVYAATKAAATLFYEAAKHFSQLRPTVFRLFAVYGPNQSEDFFIPQLIQAAKTRSTLDMTAGHQKRDFIWLEDVIDVLLECAVSPETAGLTLDVCTGITHSLREVVGIVSELSGNRNLARFGSKPYRGSEPHVIPGDPSLFKKHFPNSLRTDLSTGLAELLRTPKV